MPKTPTGLSSLNPTQNLKLQDSNIFPARVRFAMVDVKTPKITKIANKLYGIFKLKYLFYLEHGYFPPK